MNASVVSYMWLSTSNTGKSRTRDGIGCLLALGLRIARPGCGSEARCYRVACRATGRSPFLNPAADRGRTWLRVSLPRRWLRLPPGFELVVS